ncbi:MAG: TonB-dependent receptor, partial [Pyrinomonadaceae bacterium]|nr:TonB-dependent receptor [Pyrinomonadaceae bacterium]
TFFNLNDPTGLDTVELLRGPNSAQYGSDSLGGAVNLLTRNPRFGEVVPEFHGEINTAYNSADRNFGGSTFLSYGTQKIGGYVNLLGRNVGTLRTAGGIDSHAAVTRFLGLRSDVLGERLADTNFKQYGGAARLNFAPTTDQQITFFYERNQQDGGKRYDQLQGGDGNLIADLKNLMLDFGYLRYTKQNLGIFNDASFTVSYNSQREERINQGGQGNPDGDITNQYERTSSTGFSFFVNKLLPARNTVLIGGDFYHEKFKSPAFTFSPPTNRFFSSRPRIPTNAKYDSSGIYVQDSWDAIPNRLRVSGALRYGTAFYKVRAADSPIVNGNRLWNDDSVRSDGFSGRIGAVVRVVENFRLGVNYSRGFRNPSMTDLGTLGLTGDGFEVDFSTATNLGGTIGTTSGADAVSTGIGVSRQRRELTDNYDFSARYQNNRIDTEFTAFIIDLKDTIIKQSLILPQGAVGQFLGDQRITEQSVNGTVFVAASSAPVLVRANFTNAKLYGFEYELEARLTRDLKFRGNYTFIHAEDTVTGLPPNIEGGTPPPTGFISFRYEPTGKPYYIEAYSTLADKQNRLSSLDLSDRRTGATRTRTQIQNFFRRGACVRGLTNNPDGRCATGDETVLLETGENLAQVQNRVLGVGVNSAPLFTKLPSYAILNLRGGYKMGDGSLITFEFTNIADKFHRNPSWGIDGMGRSFRVGYRFRF